jgi:hypothetical protein
VVKVNVQLDPVMGLPRIEPHIQLANSKIAVCDTHFVPRSEIGTCEGSDGTVDGIVAILRLV